MIVRVTVEVVAGSTVEMTAGVKMEVAATVTVEVAAEVKAEVAVGLEVGWKKFDDDVHACLLTFYFLTFT